MRLIIAIIAALLLSSPASAQCPGGICPPHMRYNAPTYQYSYPIYSYSQPMYVAPPAYSAPSPPPATRIIPQRRYGFRAIRRYGFRTVHPGTYRQAW